MCNYMYTTYVFASLRGQNLDGFKFAEFLTLWKINMEPTNHPRRQENDLPNLHDYVPC